MVWKIIFKIFVMVSQYLKLAFSAERIRKIFEKIDIIDFGIDKTRCTERL